MADVMKISDLIACLQDAKNSYGDMPVTTWDGFIERVRITPAKDGIVEPVEYHNEIGIEIFTAYTPIQKPKGETE